MIPGFFYIITSFPIRGFILNSLLFGQLSILKLSSSDICQVKTMPLLKMKRYTLWAGRVIEPYLFENEAGGTVMVNGLLYRAMINDYFMAGIGRYWCGRRLFSRRRRYVPRKEGNNRNFARKVSWPCNNQLVIFMQENKLFQIELFWKSFNYESLVSMRIQVM